MSNLRSVSSGAQSSTEYRCTFWRIGQPTHPSPETQSTLVSLTSAAAFSELNLAAVVPGLAFARRVQCPRLVQRVSFVFCVN